jgi:hypothetical protein
MRDNPHVPLSTIAQLPSTYEKRDALCVTNLLSDLSVTLYFASASRDSYAVMGKGVILLLWW